MDNPLLITFHGLERNLKIEQLIKERFEKLIAAKPDITKCHFFLERLSKHHKTANAVIVRMDLKVPHLEDIVIAEKGSDDAASLKTTVIKVLKRGQELFYERMKYVRDQKRVPLVEAGRVEEEESLNI